MCEITSNTNTARKLESNIVVGKQHFENSYQLIQCVKYEQGHLFDLISSGEWKYLFKFLFYRKKLLVLSSNCMIFWHRTIVLLYMKIMFGNIQHIHISMKTMIQSEVEKKKKWKEIYLQGMIGFDAKILETIYKRTKQETEVASESYFG